MFILCLRSAPKDATSFDVRGTPGVDVYIVHNPQVAKVPTCVPGWPLDVGVEVVVTMKTPSNEINDNKVVCCGGGKHPLKINVQLM